MKTKTKLIIALVVSLSVALSLVGLFVFGLKDKPEEQNPLKASGQLIEDGNAEVSGAATASLREKGGCVYVSSGCRYTMNDGEIYAHKNTYGGAVYVAAGGEFYMNGGKIYGCEAKFGGAIYVENGGKIVLNGGEITGNRSATAAIYIEAGAADDCRIAEGVVFDNVNVDEYTINFYANGILNGEVSILNTSYDLLTESLPIALEECAGFFFDGELTKTIPDNFIDFETCEYVENNEINLYTKLATLDELAFTANDSGEAYNVQISPTGYKEEIVIPAKYGNAFTGGIIANDGMLTVKSVVISSTITEILDSAFYQANALESVNMTDIITTIGNNAFDGCKKLNKLVIPSTVTVLGEYAFNDCESAYSNQVVIPEGIEEIQDYTFFDCDDVRSFIIPETVTKIGSYAFSECAMITTIALPEDLEDLNTQAFSKCTGLVSIEIPYGVDKLYASTFNGCTSLESVVIPETVTSISSYVFSGCSSLEDVSIPSAVKEISIGAFTNCTSLTSITIPASVTKLGSKIFNGCTSMQTIYCEILESEVPTGSNGWKTDWFGNCTAQIVWGTASSFAPMLDGVVEQGVNLVGLVTNNLKYAYNKEN